MPETPFTIRWPDGAEQQCYSPSSIVGTYLEAGARYPLDRFLDRARGALTAASQRVMITYGYPCSRAEAQLREIEARAAAYQGGTITILTVHNSEAP